LRLGGEEGFEDSRRHRIVQAGAGIRHFDHHEAVPAQGGQPVPQRIAQGHIQPGDRDGQPAIARARLGNGIASIDGQVHQRLHETGGVHLHRGRIDLAFDHQFHGFPQHRPQEAL
jgi:hypothetical protein